jgi:hypothetical protein
MRGSTSWPSCAGATRTPNYVASEPDDANVPVQEPEQVARETLDALGRKPTLFPRRCCGSRTSRFVI